MDRDEIIQQVKEKLKVALQQVYGINIEAVDSIRASLSLLSTPSESAKAEQTAGELPKSSAFAVMTRCPKCRYGWKEPNLQPSKDLLASLDAQVKEIERLKEDNERLARIVELDKQIEQKWIAENTGRERRIEFLTAQLKEETIANKQLGEQLGAESYRFREQRQISEELRAENASLTTSLNEKAERIEKLELAVGLLNSMVACKEDHSETSRQIVEQALQPGEKE